MKLQFTGAVQLLVAFSICPSIAFKHVLPGDINHKPTRVLGGVTVVDTPLVRAAQEYTFNVSPGVLYNHTMRTWLYGVLALKHNSTGTLYSTTDLEVHALGSMLHDLGLITDVPWITDDRRFEVDSSVAATDFVETSNTTIKGQWDAHRFQLLYDAVLLSSEWALSLYKEDTVKAVTWGVLLDLKGPQHTNYGVTQAEYDAVLAAFPKGPDFYTGVNQTFVNLASGKKRATTYDNWQQAWGDAYVPGYSAVGHRLIDLVDGGFIY